MSEKPAQGAFGPDHGDEELQEGIEAEEIKAPFTFKLAIGLTVLYLAWRLVQGIVWAFERIAG